MSSDNESRLKMFLVSPELIMHMAISKSLHCEIRSEIPEGAEFVHASFDYQRHCFAVAVRHESFDVVPDGVAMPMVEKTPMVHSISPQCPSCGSVDLIRSDHGRHCGDSACEWRGDLDQLVYAAAAE